MRVKYKCRCMAALVDLDVPDRRIGADVAAWMEIVTHCVSFDHRSLQPNCRATELQELLIPLDDGSPQIGTPATRQ
jgi:hypothetical protein